MYYVSSFALQVVEKVFKKRPSIITSFYRVNKFKPHILVALRIIICDFKYPSFTSKEMTTYCEKLHRVLLNEIETKKAISVACKVVSNAIENYKRKYGQTNVRELHRIRNFTFELIEEAKKHQSNNK